MSKQNQHFGRKKCHFRRKKRPFRPKIDIFEDFDALKCNFLSIFTGMAMSIRTLTQYFRCIQVKISQGAKKNSFLVQKRQFLVKNCSFFSVSWKRPLRSLGWHFWFLTGILRFFCKNKVKLERIHLMDLKLQPKLEF